MWLKKVFLIFATLFYCFSLVGGCYDGERAALMSFKSLLTDPSNRLSTWKGENCCSWKGIKCSSSGRVVVVNLRNPHPDEVMINVNKEVVSNSNNTSDFSLKGTVYPLLFTLDHIQYLDLSFNNFVFSKLPVEISNLTKLTYLNLSNAMFQDSISTQFSNLTSLRSLDLSCANLVPDLSSVSVSLTLQPKLDVGSFLSFISYGYLSKLKFLDISFSHLGGTLPPSLSNSTSLTFFQADGCSIQGSIPSSVTKLKKLRMLTLNDNNITGQLPVSLSSLISLRYLSLIQNGLRGYIPTLICQILSLDYLNVQWNELTGSVPSCILQLPKLSYLSVQNNNLNGNMPLSLIQKSKLGMLSFGINGLSVENDVQHQPILQTFQPTLLEFTSCKMRGEIPEFFSNLTSLVILLLANNSLSGAIPYWLFNLPALSVLDLSMNNFEGVIL
ncbi:LRR receptor-like serine/threonine-protein kinase GSO1 [Capsicum annuum]